MHTGRASEDASGEDRFVDIRPQEGGLRLHVRQWAGGKRPFVLLHGLASNALTWEQTAGFLAHAGHSIYTVDQRGHGLSDKPDAGYGFATVAEDLVRLLDALGLEQPIVAGQSWGGNVVLEFGARYPGRAAGLGLIDGGVLDLQSNPATVDWEVVARELRPPPLLGTPRAHLKQMIAQHNPEWGDEGIEATLGNFETLSDGTVRPWLTLDRHMTILRALWEQRPAALYPRVREHALICVADEGHNSAWTVAKHRMVAAAQAALPSCSVHWFPDTAHDIHVHRPASLAAVLLGEVEHGAWAAPALGAVTDG